MGTLPTTGENLDLIGFELEEQPSYTHKLDIEGQRVAGMTDKREALRQAVYLILNVERYAYPIYSRNYGSELVDLIGQPMDYAMSEMKRRITDEQLSTGGAGVADSGHPPAELYERLLICRTIKLNAGAHGGHRRCCHAKMQKNAQNKPQIARLILCVHTTLQFYCNLFLTFCIFPFHAKPPVLIGRGFRQNHRCLGSFSPSFSRPSGR